MGLIISTKADPVVQDAAGLPVVALAPAKVFSAMVEIPAGISNAKFKTVTVYYVKDTATAANLKFTLRHINTDTLPSTQTTSADSLFNAETLAGTTGQTDSFDVPAARLTAFSGMDTGDQIGIDIERKSDDTGVLNILRVDFEMDVEAVSSSIDLVTLTSVKEYLGIGTTHTDTGKDSMLQTWITLVSGWFEGECNRKFQLQTITGEVLNGEGRKEIYPRWAPIYSLASVDTTQDVMVRDDPTASWVVLEATASKILLDPNEPWKIILYDNYFPIGIMNIKLNYRAGYAAVPAKMQMAAFDAMQVMWHKSRQGDNRLMISSFSQNTGGANFNTVYKDMSKESHDALNQFRRLV